MLHNTGPTFFLNIYTNKCKLYKIVFSCFHFQFQCIAESNSVLGSKASLRDMGSKASLRDMGSKASLRDMGSKVSLRDEDGSDDDISKLCVLSRHRALHTVL